MPLKAITDTLDGLDDAVGGGRFHLQALGQPLDALAVDGVHHGLALAEDLLQHRKLLIEGGQLGFQRRDAAPLRHRARRNAFDHGL